jgi:hypothetical protein
MSNNQNLGLKIETGESQPRSSKFGLKIETGESQPRSSKFGLKIETGESQPRSSKFGLKIKTVESQTKPVFGQETVGCEELSKKLNKLGKKSIDCGDAVLIGDKCHIFNKKIGQGSFGTVYNSETTNGFVLKDSTILSTLEMPCMRKNELINFAKLRMYESEKDNIKLFARYKTIFPMNILHTFAPFACVDKTDGTDKTHHMYVLMEKVDNLIEFAKLFGDDFKAEKNENDLIILYSILTQYIYTILYINMNHVYHRDIKFDNIVCSKYPDMQNIVLNGLIHANNPDKNIHVTIGTEYVLKYLDYSLATHCTGCDDFYVPIDLIVFLSIISKNINIKDWVKDEVKHFFNIVTSAYPTIKYESMGSAEEDDQEDVDPLRQFYKDEIENIRNIKDYIKKEKSGETLSDYEKKKIEEKEMYSLDRYNSLINNLFNGLAEKLKTYNISNVSIQYNSSAENASYIKRIASWDFPEVTFIQSSDPKCEQRGGQMKKYDSHQYYLKYIEYKSNYSQLLYGQK